MLFPVHVQGEGAAAEIVAAIKYFNRKQIVDVLISGARRRLARRPVGVQRGDRRAGDCRLARFRSFPAWGMRPISRLRISWPTCAPRRPRPRRSWWSARGWSSTATWPSCGTSWRSRCAICCWNRGTACVKWAWTAACASSKIFCGATASTPTSSSRRLADALRVRLERLDRRFTVARHAAASVDLRARLRALAAGSSSAPPDLGVRIERALAAKRQRPRAAARAA